MTERKEHRGTRIAAVLFAVAALLLLGRGTALLYVDRSWYAALGASTVWRARMSNTVIMHALAVLVGTTFAYLNVAAVRSSIIALVLPKRVGDVDVGEEFPASRLLVIAAAMSLFIAIVATLALPSWTTLALWRSHITFGETDPYFGFDLGFYVAWLPLETAIYIWAIVLFAIVTVVVVVLYSLTPSLRWGNGTVRISAHARRHLAVLGAMLVLFVAWGFRLDAYDVLMSHGTDVFTSFDHKWVIPADVSFSVIAVAAAVVLVIAGWMGQTVLALAGVSVVLVAAVVSKILLPSVEHYATTRSSAIAAQAPYRATRAAFTRRAFPPEPIVPSARFAADSTLLAEAPHLHLKDGPPPIVYPGAQGVVVETDSARRIQAPRVGGRVTRIMYAWAEQNPTLFQADLPRDAAFIRRRDLRDRITAVAPMFAQSPTVGARPTPIGIMWIVDLYSVSDRYPLSEERVWMGDYVRYRRHAATAYVSGMTGGVTIVPDDTLDPLARAWLAQHPGAYASATVPHELTMPWPPAAAAPNIPAVQPDSIFRTQILNLYTRMRAALNAGDLRAFGDAFDSLGAALGVRLNKPQ